MLELLTNNLPYMLKATIATIYLSSGSICCGLLIATFFGVLSVYGARTVRVLIRAYVYYVRGVPELVLFFVVFYLIPLLGIQTSKFVAAFITLSVWTSSFMTEIIRGAILSIPKGQTEAARSLGFTSRKSAQHIILPQTVTRAIPPLINEFAKVIKTTSVASIIGVWELTYAAKEISEITYRPLEIYGVAAVVYFILSYLVFILGEKTARRFAYKA
jgi:polar amino acid transport system permease protein